MHACSCYWGSEELGCRTLRIESQRSAGLRMQPYPGAPGLIWPGHLHGTGCLSARAADTGFPTIVWHWCLGLGFAITLPILAGVLGGCAWVRDFFSSLHSWLGFVMCAVRRGFWLARRHSWPRFGGVSSCVRAPPAPLLFLARVCGVGMCAWAQVSAAPRHCLLGCWRLCVFVCVL